MRRVLSIGSMYPPHSEGGYELAWQSNVRWLRERGYAVRVLASDFHTGDAAGSEDHDVHRDLRWYWHAYEFPPRSAVDRLRIERHNAAVLRRHLKEHRPDTVIWWGMGGMSLSLVEQVRRAGIPATGHVGDDWMLYGPQVDAWLRAWSSRRRSARLAEIVTRIPTAVEMGRAAVWHFVSEHTRSKALEVWNLPRTVVTPAGIDRRLFTARAEQPWRWRLLCVGRLDPRKGIDTAIRALELLPPESTLEVVGDGDPAYARQLAALAEELDLSDRVHIAGGCPHGRMPEVYGEADAVVFPVRWEEPWGLVPIEAMAVGRPVLATGTGGSGEYLRDDVNCLLFPLDDAAALAAALQRLAADPSLRQTLREGGAATAARYGEDSFNESLGRSIEEHLPGLR